MPFRRILCPVDFSAHSRDALRYAAAVTERARGRLTVLTVNDPLLAAAAAAAAYDNEALRAATDKELRRFVRRAVGEGGLRRIAYATALGQPAPEIRKAIRRHAIDLVVMGTHGLSGAGKWFFGSTTEQVLRVSDVAVLAVPKGRGKGRGRPDTRQWPGRTIVAAIDLGDRAVADARAAAALARWFGARALLLHVLAPSRVPAWIGADADAQDRARQAAAEGVLRTIAHTAGNRCSYLVLVGDPVDQVAAATRTANARLIVSTLKRPVEPFGPRRGSITYRALCAGAVPVLALP